MTTYTYCVEVTTQSNTTIQAVGLSLPQAHEVAVEKAVDGAKAEIWTEQTDQLVAEYPAS
jgi:hypothetical protein